MKPSTRQNRTQDVQWLDRGGGPFVVVPASRLSTWRGLGGENDPVDFDRACDVADYIETIPFGGLDALVLGDDPFPTAYLPGPTFGGGYLIRRLWGDDTRAAIDAVHELRPSAWTPESLTFDAADGTLVLFDAANVGSAILHRVDIPLGAGRYAIDSADVQPDESLCLLVHRLVPVS